MTESKHEPKPPSLCPICPGWMFDPPPLDIEPGCSLEDFRDAVARNYDIVQAAIADHVTEHGLGAPT